MATDSPLAPSHTPSSQPLSFSWEAHWSIVAAQLEDDMSVMKSATISAVGPWQAAIDLFTHLIILYLNLVTKENHTLFKRLNVHGDGKLLEFDVPPTAGSQLWTNLVS